MANSYIFREQLGIRYPTQGHALWDPDPGGLYNTVDVGDVGVIREGIFYRLFNALHPIDSQFNSDPRLSPSLPLQLRPRKSSHIYKSDDNRTFFHSVNVTKVPHESDISALLPTFWSLTPV
jgi:hypothetical protein